CGTQLDTRFIVRTFAPVTEREITTRIGYAVRSSKLFEYLDAMRDQILCGFLATFSLIRTPQASGQSPNAEQHFSCRRLVETIELWRFVSLRPKLAERFAGSFVFASFLKLFG